MQDQVKIRLESDTYFPLSISTEDEKKMKIIHRNILSTYRCWFKTDFHAYFSSAFVNCIDVFISYHRTKKQNVE